MFQDIAPHTLDNSFHWESVQPHDLVVVWDRGCILFLTGPDGDTLPTYSRLVEDFSLTVEPFFLFSIDQSHLFLCPEPLEEREGYTYKRIDTMKSLQPSWFAFACASAAHLAKWYTSHRFCGKCGAELEHSHTERALHCPECNLTIYPGISPVVIVGVTDGDRLLLTRYANGEYRRHALIAGFVEFGETLEDGARREVMEEVGLHIKNLRYYKSQPWAFSESLLAGFFAEVDGSKEAAANPDELSEAVWFTRDQLPRDDSNMSLTWSMIEAFRNGEV